MVDVQQARERYEATREAYVREAVNSGYITAPSPYTWDAMQAALDALIAAVGAEKSGLNRYCAICYHPLDKCSHCDRPKASTAPDIY